MKKCIVNGCKNHTDEGTFVGDLCMPCHQFITIGIGTHSQMFRNALAASSLINLKVARHDRIEGNEVFPHW